jgi:transcriptional regulator with XRE-family HTH domain
MAPDDSYADLARELRRRRAEAGMTIRALAERAGLGHNTVWKAEHGSVPDAPTLAALLSVLGCELTLNRPGEVSALRSQNRCYREALDALARQPVLTHDLIDQARAAVAGTHTQGRTAA